MDGDGCGFLASLHPDVAFVTGKILTCLDDPADIVRAMSVSCVWRDLIISNRICKHLCLRLFPQLTGIARIVDTCNTQQQQCSDICSSRSTELEQLKKEHIVFVSLARGLTRCEISECLSDAIGASSCDNYPEESVIRTLEPGDRIGRRASYWSSSGQSDPEVPEKLTYKLISDFCVITEINIQPFQAFFQADNPIFSAKSVRFRMGYKVLPSSNGKGGQPSADEVFVWNYTSEEFPMVQENRLQNFKLPKPVLCIGGFLQIELLGRVQRQEIDGLFYICVAYVQVLGRALAPVFIVNPLDSGRFLLMFNPEAQFSGPPSIQENPHKISITTDQILNMGHLTLLDGVYDSEDETS